MQSIFRLKFLLETKFEKLESKFENEEVIQ